MKLYRYVQSPAMKDYHSWQCMVVTQIRGPFGYEEFSNHYYKPGIDMHNWLFAFTKDQLRIACLLAKEHKDKFNETAKSRIYWEKLCKLVSFEVPDEDVLVLPDQVVFYAPNASIPVSKLR